MAQGETLLACYSNRSMTGQRAADDFAATFWGQPERITGWDGAFFQMENKLHWYRVREADCGWEIVRTEKLV